jgi:hypothetical protein
VRFGAGERAARVRIVSGSQGIDGSFGTRDDAVVMDDFIFAEPLASVRVPEPAGLALLATGLIALTLVRRRRA